MHNVKVSDVPNDLLPDATPDELVSAEVSALLGIDRSTLTRWIKNGQIRTKRKLPGKTGSHLFARADVAVAKAGLSPHDHNPKQHRDGKPPWCGTCGLTADFAQPVSRIGASA